MTTPMDKALMHMRSVQETASVTVLDMKKAGRIPDVFNTDGSSFGQLGQFFDQGSYQQRYGLFRGWVHSAVNAIAEHAALQPCQLGRLLGSDNGKKPKRTKFYNKKVLPNHLRSKSADSELEVLQGHSFYDVLEHPNPIQHRWQFVYSFIANLCLTGWGFIIGG